MQLAVFTRVQEVGTHCKYVQCLHALEYFDITLSKVLDKLCICKKNYFANAQRIFY